MVVYITGCQFTCIITSAAEAYREGDIRLVGGQLQHSYRRGMNIGSSLINSIQHTL